MSGQKEQQVPPCNTYNWSDLEVRNCVLEELVVRCGNNKWSKVLKGRERLAMMSKAKAAGDIRENQ